MGYSPNWRLEMSLVGPHGERFTVAMELGDAVRDAWAPINPPGPFDGFANAVHVMKTREFRKDLFRQTAANMGALLAERLEDKEGWHGVDRAERLRDFGRDGVVR